MEDRRYINRVILLSDGLANVGPSSPDELARLGTSLGKEGISVTTIARLSLVRLSSAALARIMKRPRPVL